MKKSIAKLPMQVVKKGFILTISLIYIFLLGVKIFQASPNPMRVLPANIGAHSFSVGWITQRVNQGCVVIIEKAKNPQILFKCDQYQTYTHLINFDEVFPQTTYKIYIISGLNFKVIDAPSVDTIQISDTPPPLPEPAYGVVVDLNGHPVEDAFVYIYPKSNTKHNPIATLTNRDGKFAIDISEIFQKSDRLIIETAASGAVWVDIDVSASIHTPFPPITAYTK